MALMAVFLVLSLATISRLLFCIKNNTLAVIAIRDTNNISITVKPRGYFVI